MYKRFYNIFKKSVITIASIAIVLTAIDRATYYVWQHRINRFYKGLLTMTSEKPPDLNELFASPTMISISRGDFLNYKSPDYAADTRDIVYMCLCYFSYGPEPNFMEVRDDHLITVQYLPPKLVWSAWLAMRLSKNPLRTISNRGYEIEIAIPEITKDTQKAITSITLKKCSYSA